MPRNGVLRSFRNEEFYHLQHLFLWATVFQEQKDMLMKLVQLLISATDYWLDANMKQELRKHNMYN